MRLVTTTNRMEAVPSHQNSKMSHMCLFVSGYIPEDSLFVCECVHAWVLRVCFPSTAPDNEHYKLRVTGKKRLYTARFDYKASKQFISAKVLNSCKYNSIVEESNDQRPSLQILQKFMRYGSIWIKTQAHT